MGFLIIIAILSSIVSYTIAKSKNRNAVAWFFAGMLLIPVLIVALSPVIGKECPQCAETVQAEAKVCRYCGYKLPYV